MSLLLLLNKLVLSSWRISHSFDFALDFTCFPIPCNFYWKFRLIGFSSVQLLSHVPLFATPRIAARQASLSITNSQSSLRLMSIESVMPSSHLNLCRPLLLLPPIPPSIRVFSNESLLPIRWSNYQSFNFSISPPMNSQDRFP